MIKLFRQRYASSGVKFSSIYDIAKTFGRLGSSDNACTSTLELLELFAESLGPECSNTAVGILFDGPILEVSKDND